VAAIRLQRPSDRCALASLVIPVRFEEAVPGVTDATGYLHQTTFGGYPVQQYFVIFARGDTAFFTAMSSVNGMP
jgi:hypothetical protein